MSLVKGNIDDVLIRQFCTDYDREHFTRAEQELIARVRLHVLTTQKSTVQSARQYSLELLEEIRKAIET